MMIGGGIALAGLLLAAAGWKLRRPVLRSAGLGVVMVGFFITFASGLPGRFEVQPSLRGVLLLASAVAVFRLMAGFERAREPDPPVKGS